MAARASCRVGVEHELGDGVDASRIAQQAQVLHRLHADLHRRGLEGPLHDAEGPVGPGGARAAARTGLVFLRAADAFPRRRRQATEARPSARTTARKVM